MKNPVWHSTSKGTARGEFVAFAAGRDVVALTEADTLLIPYDLWTNRVHAHVLKKIGLFNEKEFSRLMQALDSLEALYSDGGWKLDPALEDVHINIEAFVTEQCGSEIGGKLHSGRSRNDQAATDMKLLARDAVLHFLEETLILIEALLQHAQDYTDAVMPGYTHHRKATLTTWGHYCASYAQGLQRDAVRWIDLYKRINASPLGAAASYGTTWPLDRALAAELLAFDSVQENTLDAVMSRGEAEAEIAQALALQFKRLGTIAQDLILFSTDEFGYLSLPSDFTTGSSIMPQKRNPDFAEAIKGKAGLIFGYANALLSMNAGNLSGYNKDVQWSKYVFLDVIHEAQSACTILAEVMSGVIVHREKMLTAASNGFLNAVDIADHLARTRNTPFRLTYRILSEAVGLSSSGIFDMQTLNGLLQQNEMETLSDDEFNALNNPLTCVETRDHTGSPHPKQVTNQISTMRKALEKQQQWLQAQRDYVKAKRERSRKVL